MESGEASEVLNKIDDERGYEGEEEEEGQLNVGEEDDSESKSGDSVGYESDSDVDEVNIFIISFKRHN